jgi:hypothetical protein
MKMIATDYRILRIVPLLIAVCLVGIPAQAKYAGSGVAASAETSTYVFVPDQSKLVQTGGIASVPRTYSVKGEFQLTVDPNAGSASFTHVDANATDDSQFKHTLDLNRVFNMTLLVGTVVDDTTIIFTGKASEGSDVRITVTLQDDLAHLIGQTTPPPNSADFFIFNLDAVAQRKYSRGSGTADDPYQIATAEDLIALGESPEDYDKHFILTDNIDLDPNLLGRKVFDKAVLAPDTDPNDKYSEFQGTRFTGAFDGNGHTISHLRVTGASYLGLFGRLESGAEVKNLGVVDVSITGSGDDVGGLVGYNDGGAVTNCYSTGVVNAVDYVGGLVGENSGSITTSYSTGTVNGKNDVGGLVGWNGWPVSDCYSTGPVSGQNLVGGLVGSNGGAVTRCYSTGAVSGSEYVGGLAGQNFRFLYLHGTVIDSFWDTQTSAQTTSAGGTGKTTAEMKTARTFLDAGWDFVNVWGIGENQTYPYLRKYSAADINQDASVNFLDLAVLAENWLTGVSP